MPLLPDSLDPRRPRRVDAAATSAGAALSTIRPTSRTTIRPRARLAALLAVFALALPGCEGPFLVLPGGALEGPEVPAPADWGFTDPVGTVQLETRPDEPYSVNIWIVALDGHLYLHAGANRAEWVGHLEADPRARVRVDGSIYRLAAVRVVDQAEFDRFSDAYERKYDTRPRNEDAREAYLFRLTARPD